MVLEKFTKDSIISLSNLTVIKEIDEYTIGDEQKNIFFRVPKEAIYVIEEAKGHNTIEEIQDSILQNKKIEIDVLDFMNTLNSLGVINDINLDEDRKNNFIQSLGKFLFNKATITFYIINILLTIILLIAFPNKLTPNYQDTFVLSSIGLSLLLFFFVSWFLVFVHEGAHYLAVSATGKKMNFQLSIRWFWVVIEANMNTLWSIPREKRYIPFLAGFFIDILIINISFMLILVINDIFIISLLKMIALIQFYKIIWQFIIFLRTDFYYVLLNYFGVSTLTKGSIAYLLRKISPKYNLFFDKLSSREQIICKRYSWLYIVSLFAVCYLFLFLSIPTVLYTLKTTLSILSTFAYNTFEFWDSFIVLALLLFEFILWIIAAYKRFKRGA
ncbi:MULTISPECIES: hypothetical protein [Lysinibacillus]|uniref:hypothetical protein n=1 Tax=Lysinibacillus TaxID=400634 RepID=UPI002175E07D|nr:hypothetical protein [Lysinibacillus sp. A4]MCS5504088.1 hypothetical protein [Lysinibacillus sp. A4]UNT57541.1 hypothetical protein ICJ70_11115 [Lysinibacillus capsici]